MKRTRLQKNTTCPDLLENSDVSRLKNRDTFNDAKNLIKEHPSDPKDIPFVKNAARKKKNLPIVLGASLGIIVFFSATLYNGGSPGRKSGSPLDGASCTQCHTGTSLSSEWITTTIPATGYVRGETYTLTLSAAHQEAARFGFELTAENSTEKKGLFTITQTERTKLTNNNQAVTHTSGGTSPNNGQISWNVEWTAPEEDAGAITFYAATNAANGNGSTSGDQIFTSALTVSPATTHNGQSIVQSPLKVYPNPASGWVFLETSSPVQNIVLMNTEGKIIRHLNGTQQNPCKLNVEGFTPGIYVLKVETKEEKMTKTLQIQ
ncbi:MAG TPA: T9SS type A sorting domain-containing protein [Prolixibacteraceae bacterium]|nr:T9SS type A sorting domain-containing protein [Prolixibacteraceae bacterium]